MSATVAVALHWFVRDTAMNGSDYVAAIIAVWEAGRTCVHFAQTLVLCQSSSSSSAAAKKREGNNF